MHNFSFQEKTPKFKIVGNFGLKKNATAKPVFGLAEAQGEQT